MKRLYALLLYLFPSSYRQEYGDELQAVFDLSLAEAVKSSEIGVVLVTVRELFSLPKAVLYEHLRARRKAFIMKRFGSYLDFSYGSWKEFLTAILPFFLLGGALPIINFLGRQELIQVPNPVTNGIMVGLLGLFVILFVAGLATGLPRWSLPYAGFLFSLLSAYGLGCWLNREHFIPFTALYNHSWLVGQIAYQGSIWAGLTVLSLLLALLFEITPIFRRFRSDWTLLVFLLYGTTPFVLVSSFDDYVHEEPYELIAFFILIFGMWFYLHTDDSRQRFWALFGGMTVSLFFAAVSKAILGLSQPWFHGNQIDWWGHEMMTTIIMWMWIALSMLVPFALRLPSEKDEALTTSEI